MDDIEVALLELSKQVTLFVQEKGESLVTVREQFLRQEAIKIETEPNRQQ